ncbi:MAG: hypothetical protein IKG21_12945 [Atopobiaceae bacterium]|nr:hypothetical protein [Atopobiaceae bacterium]
MSRPRRVSGPRPYFKSRDRCERNATLAVSALTLNEREGLACLLSETHPRYPRGPRSRTTCTMEGKAWVRFFRTDRDDLREIWRELCARECGDVPRRYGRGRVYDYDEVMRLHGQGVSGAEIARRIGASSRFVVNNIIRKCKEEEE